MSIQLTVLIGNRGTVPKLEMSVDTIVKRVHDVA
jgi:hypothetical protein